MHELRAQSAWSLLRNCARLARQLSEPCSFAWCGEQLRPMAGDGTDEKQAIVHWDGVEGWSCIGEFRSEIADFLDLYLPVCMASAMRPLSVGHLGQSLDGYVATSTGDSQFVNDRQNIVHLHRMRALCDAVVVGGATVRDDDPQLTVRFVSGHHPLRVIIDPKRQLHCEYKVFNDDAANTLLVTLQDDPPTHSERSACVQVLSVPADANGNPDLRALMHALHSRGCFAVFVEGGGITVSRFVDANLLDRMQIAVAPVFIGQGREGLRVAAQQSLDDCLRPSHRLFRMGADLLFDCNLRIPPLDDTNGLSDGRYRSAIATGADSVIDDLSEMACAAPLPVRML